MWAFFCFKGV